MYKMNRRQAVWLCLTILWMAVIFWFSHQPAEESGQISGTICYKIVYTLDHAFHLKWSDSRLEQNAQLLSYPVRKTAHMTEYAVLAILLLQLMYASAEKYALWKYYLLPQFLASLYAVTDEFHQLFIPGRCGALADVGIDSIGAGIGLLLSLSIARQIKERRKKI